MQNTAEKPSKGLKKRAKKLANFLNDNPEAVGFLEMFSDCDTRELERIIHDLFWKAISNKDAVFESSLEETMEDYDCNKALFLEMIRHLRDISDLFQPKSVCLDTVSHPLPAILNSGKEVGDE